MFSTSSSRRTVLHIAVIAGHENIVEELVKTGKDKLVKMQDNCGYTALALAAEQTGSTNIAKCIVEMRGRGGNALLSMKTNGGEIPVLLAAAKAHKEMTQYLYDRTPLEELDGKNVRNGILLLTRCITAEIFGLREVYDQKMTHFVARQILKCLYERVREFDESQLREASAYDAMLQAAKHGIIEFIDEMSKANPNLLWAIDQNRRGIFSHAIMNRRKAVFQLIHSSKVDGRRDIIRPDVFNNTLLHLAAYLGPSSDLDCRSGPALQMQREIQWFKAVEKIVHPKCKEAKNVEVKTPRELFTESHKELVKAGEKWAKDTAGHFTLVGTLIITIMFAAAFTIPGGNNQESGVPIFLRDRTFTAFIISDALSLFTSSTSVLLFIGVLTSRYAEKDFLKSLPWKLLFGLLTLFLSVVAMIVAFCSSLAMILKGHERIKIVAMSLGCLPVIVLIPSQLRLFLEILKSTARSK